MNSAMQTAFDSWTPPVATIATLLLTAVVYVRGFNRLHRQMPRRFPSWRLASFIAGIAALFIAIASPLEAFDDLLLQLHMTQHLLLMLVAPSLLLAGAPAIPLVRGLPPRVARAIVGPILRSAAIRGFFTWLTQPLVCWIAFV
ncbi:MAG TPA: cytochrome c oxidase assembly protein, partial [Candidatus Acidoferrum sp.]|nr:cytochrome c oxidase assembly protein [Candidatus Acidoferrum sp.]